MAEYNEHFKFADPFQKTSMSRTSRYRLKRKRQSEELENLESNPPDSGNGDGMLDDPGILV